MSDSGVQAWGSSVCQAASELISARDLNVLQQLTLTDAGTSLTVGDFLAKLFIRGPQELLKAATPTDAARVVSGCCSVLEAFEVAPDQIAVAVGSGLAGPAIFLALPDCPFIISSIAERLSEARVTVEAFQHPIVRYKTTQVALSFIEISSPVEPSELSSVVASLTETLRSLNRIVADYDPMRTVIANRCSLPQAHPLKCSFGKLEASEVRDFIAWLSEGAFFFLGTALWDESSSFDYSEGCGAFRIPGAYRDALVTEVREDIQKLHHESADLSIRKLRLTSPVHRPATVLNIVIRLGDSPQPLISIVGYLTSKAWAHEAEDIPILRRKVANALAREGSTPNSFDHKYQLEVIDNIPTDEALSMPIERLVEIAQLALGVFSSQSMRSRIFVDDLLRRALSVIIVPPQRFSSTMREAIQTTLERALRAASHSSEFHLDSSKRRQLRLYFSTPLPRDFSGPLPDALLAQSFMQASLTWEEKLFDATTLYDEVSEVRGIFPQDYQAATDIAEATEDIKTLATLSKSAPLAVVLFSSPQAHRPPVISIFSLGTTVSISQATPVLENIGLEVLRAHSYSCSFKGQSAFILKLALRTYDGTALDSDRFNQAVSPGLIEILAGRAHSDPLNSLLRRAPLNVRQVALLRAYCALLWQVQKIATKRTMWEALAGAPDVAFKLFTIFDTMFNPASNQALFERQALCSTQSASLLESLRKVPDITHDRVLRALFVLVQNTVRTNFYTNTDTFAFKITPEKIEFMPHPRPLFEIFVFSPRIEGTHLRSARVARGGIRWSERTDDYRAEVLGLMKTQKVKNVIIVPSGAKGGFVNKQPPTDPAHIPAAVEQCYREYITALLSLADNDTAVGIQHPAGCIVHDQPDPYFVVAADKGTATFSDVANGIAQKSFSFWLGDAFASGGSQGYDHKKYGITAKGGWACVERHFRDLGIDYLHAPFTVVGIGDMSGDVFGNALLLSRHASLIAAFNHKHIFIDPHPDNTRAFDERKRLFELPRSQWSDYNSGLISAGGGVFNRFDKEINLLPEARRALSISDEVPAIIDGETLIRHILQAKVDLLWNGGIGTYVKAHSESHSDVNDGTNDRVRINADELRARVVGEGGNLGFTQRARVEFAQEGGRINTDAIDNSGGVDLSDHEVNLKLLLNPIVAKGAITLEQRNQILKEIAEQVVESVLEHNRSQALMLTIAQQRSPFLMEQYRSFIREMNRLGYLDRIRDNLPDDEELDDRISQKRGLSRPELAYCNAAMKMYAKEELCRSSLCADPYLEPILLNYFPVSVQDQFLEDVRRHPLRAEIVASELVNQLIPVVDIPFIFTLAQSSGAAIPAVIASIIAADQILGLSTIRKRLQQFDSPADSTAFIELWRHCCNALRHASSWLTNVHGGSVSLADLVGLYQLGVEEVIRAGGTGWEVETLTHPLPLTTAETARLQLYKEVIPIFEVLWTAHECKGSIAAVSSIFSSVVTATGVQFLFPLEGTITPSNRWEQELIRTAYQEIRRSISELTGQLYRDSVRSPDQVQSALSAAKGFATMRSTLQDILQRVNSKRSFEVAALTVLARQLRLLRLE